MGYRIQEDILPGHKYAPIAAGFGSCSHPSFVVLFAEVTKFHASLIPQLKRTYKKSASFSWYFCLVDGIRTQ